MATPQLAPRGAFRSILVVWIVAVVVGVAVGVFAPVEWRSEWLTVGLGGCLLVSFVVHLWHGRSQGFTQRVAASALGSLLILAIMSLGFGLASIVPG